MIKRYSNEFTALAHYDYNEKESYLLAFFWEVLSIVEGKGNKEHKVKLIKDAFSVVFSELRAEKENSE
jgi:hypothetical protein